jgi:hypothetical protein
MELQILMTQNGSFANDPSFGEEGVNNPIAISSSTDLNIGTENVLVSTGLANIQVDNPDGSFQAGAGILFDQAVVNGQLVQQSPSPMFNNLTPAAFIANCATVTFVMCGFSPPQGYSTFGTGATGSIFFTGICQVFF